MQWILFVMDLDNAVKRILTNFLEILSSSWYFGGFQTSLFYVVNMSWSKRIQKSKDKQTGCQQENRLAWMHLQEIAEKYTFMEGRFQYFTPCLLHSRSTTIWSELIQHILPILFLRDPWNLCCIRSRIWAPPGSRQ